MRFQLKLAALAAAVLGVAVLGTAAADEAEKIKDVKGCMAFQNKVRGDLPKQLKSKTPDWDAIQKQTHEWVGVAEALGKQKPPKGSEESWKKQTDLYLTHVKAVDAAAEKKDADAANKALATIGSSCGGCHSQHKPKK
jgi:cytochrome c556